MELMQLEMFVAMVEESSFQKAAERLFRTQPALSMAIRKLEQEIGSPLFDRSVRNSYILTDTGTVLYEYARRMLNLRDETLDALKQLHTLQTGRIRIGANESTSLYLLPQLILQFRQQYPSIKIEVVRGLSARLPHELTQRSIDFAILSFLPEERELHAMEILRDELQLIVSPQHDLAGRERVQIHELGGESFIAHNMKSPARDKVVETFRQCQTPLNITIELTTIETIKRFVLMNLGIGFVPQMCVRGEVERGELVIVPVEGFKYERTLWAVRRKSENHSHAAQAFIAMLESLNQNLPQDAVAITKEAYQSSPKSVS